MAKYLEVRQSSESFDLTELDDTLTAITTLHPELIMEDNSVIIFPNQKSYYKFISDAELFNTTDNEIYTDYLLENYDNECYFPDDSISFDGNDISLIFAITLDDDIIYYIIRDGENELACVSEGLS